MTSKIIFNIAKKIDNNSTKYYHCSKCNKYSTDNASNFKRQLISCNPSEYLDLCYSNYLNQKENKLSPSKTHNRNFFNSIINLSSQEDSNEQIKINSLNLIENASTINLKNLLEEKNHLNKCDYILDNNYLFHSNKKINSGSFSERFIGEDLKTRIKIIILKTKKEYIEEIKNEEYILQKIHGSGNFPPLYKVLYDNSHAYFIEGMMGFNLNDLFKLCDRNFDLITVINIGIDLIKNIKILHDKGFIHRDLKPDNLVFGCLCPENIKFKNN